MLSWPCEREAYQFTLCSVKKPFPIMVLPLPWSCPSWGTRGLARCFTSCLVNTLVPRETGPPVCTAGAYRHGGRMRQKAILLQVPMYWKKNLAGHLHLVRSFQTLTLSHSRIKLGGLSCLCLLLGTDRGLFPSAGSSHSLSFPLPLVGDELEGRLKCLRTIIKSRVLKKLKLQSATTLFISTGQNLTAKLN